MQIAVNQYRSTGIASTQSMPRWVAPTAKIALFAAIGAVVMGIAWLVLPTLQTAGPWGYAGAFLIQTISSASIMVPVPGLAALMVMAQELDPIMLAGAGAAGAAIGELTGYWLGAQGRGAAHRFKWFDRVQAQMDKRGGIVVLAFSAIPVLPMDAIGIMSGAVRYPVGKFLLGTFVGRFAMLVVALFSAREVVAAVL